MPDTREKKRIKPFLNGALARIAPTFAAKRELSAAKYEYLAARTTRSRAPVKGRNENPNTGSAENDRRSLVDQSRELYENNPIAQGLIDRYALLCFGRMKRAARTGDDDRDKVIDDFIEGYCFPNADISGRFNFLDLVPQLHKSRNKDGDILLAWRMCPDTGMPTLQAIESDRIGSTFYSLASDDYVAGLHIDPNTGRVFLYDVYRRQPNSDTLIFDYALPAKFSMFYARYDRVSRYRGIPLFASALESARDLTEIIAATRDRVKFAASLSAIVKSKGGGIEIDELLNEGGEVNPHNNEWEQNTKFGQIYNLDVGEDVTTLQGNYPDQSVQSFLDLLVHHFCLAAEIPYSIGYKLAGVTGPGVRMDAALAERTVQREQQNMRRTILDPVIRKWIRWGCLTDKLPYDYQNPAIYQGMWSFSRKLSIDTRDERIDAEMVQKGLKSKLRFFEDREMDYHEETEEIVNEQVRERQLAKDKGVDYLDIRLITQSGQQHATQGPLHEEMKEEGTSGQF